MKKAQTEDACFALVESTSDSMYLVDENCRYLFINSRHLSRLGMSTADIIGRPYGDFHSPEDTKIFAEKVKQVFTTGKSVQHEHQSARDNRYFLRTFSPVKEVGPDGKITSLAVVSKDITEHRRAEELYKTLAESSFAAVFIVQNGKFRFINTSAIAYAGYTAEELIDQESYIIVHPEDREKVNRMSREMLAGARNAAFEFRMVTKQNDVRWISQTVTPINYGGKPAILGNAIDVTELKQVEEALRKSERLHNVILGSPFPAFAIGKDHRVMHWNKAMEELSGIKAEEAIGTIQELSVFYGTERPCMAYLLVDEFVEAIPKYYAGEYVKSSFMEEAYETTNFFPEMGEGGRWIRFTATAVRDSKGDVIGAIETLEDITERKQAEGALHKAHEELERRVEERTEELRQLNIELKREIDERILAEKALRESREELQFLTSELITAQENERRRISRELHDELGQALAGLKIHLVAIEEKFRKDQQTLKRQCGRLLSYVDEIIENVRRLSRDLSPVSLELMGLSSSLNYLFSDFSEHHHIDCTLDIDKIDNLFSKQSQISIYRIFQECLTNIIRHSQATHFSVAIKNKNDHVSLMVEDNGRGFNVKKILTRKASQRGIGIAAMQERVRMLGGSLDIWSQEGLGTRITYNIPIDI